MLVPIALLTGITDIAALTALVGVNMTMIWFGYLHEFPREPGMRPFWLGSVAGLVLWIAISIYLVGEKTYIVLSFTAKSAFAWQVFSGTLAG